MDRSLYDHSSSTRTIQFRADQITAENQGVEISGFAVWRVADAGKAAANFDFTEAEAASAIGGALQDVVESAIRHLVARMTIEDALRKRAEFLRAQAWHFPYSPPRSVLARFPDPPC